MRTFSEERELDRGLIKSGKQPGLNLAVERLIDIYRPTGLKRAFAWLIPESHFFRTPWLVETYDNLIELREILRQRTGDEHAVGS